MIIGFKKKRLGEVNLEWYETNIQWGRVDNSPDSVLH